ncbi:agmatinase [Natrialba swarupiae]|uniref:Agmatinase n=1 Tax=Natrialba swarupiae TaxID=2448032 RepID=A0A5D5AKA2_9EURY|nr:agmatinase [Natrialba swarupiae]TYT62116.1 agmatinase [Natrialba swarupiae]
MIDPQEVPRFAGVPSFMRMPHTYDLSDGVEADAAFLGIPFDDATTYRPGARFGPRAIREASTLLKPYNSITETNLQEYSIVDHDDVPVVPGYIEETFAEIEERVGYVLESGVIPAIAGGDHSTTLPVLRAVAEKHGPVSLVQFDAHSDLWTEYFGKDHNHGTTVHTAIEEGLIDPETSIRIGDRGGLYSADDVDLIEDSGIEYLTTEEAASRGFDSLGDRIHDRVDGPAFATIDIDVVDPAFAPGTGTPMPGGLTSREILRLTRSLHDIDLVGFDLVEVAPTYDPAETTSVLAANVMFEALCAALDGTTA